jgi:hypothetical protein
MKHIVMAFAALTIAASAHAAKPSPSKREQSATARNDVVRTKAALLRVVGLCRGGACDPLRKSSDPELVDLVLAKEKAFVEACRSCASADACESERQRIRDGERSRGAEPCR